MSERSHPLSGRLIALPETRELDRLAGMLEEQGAKTLRCPMVAILDLDDDGAALEWLRRLASGGFDGFLRKPFHVRQVIEAIEDAVAVVY